jgi:hypothetical protein
MGTYDRYTIPTAGLVTEFSTHTGNHGWQNLPDAEGAWDAARSAALNLVQPGESAS